MLIGIQAGEIVCPVFRWEDGQGPGYLVIWMNSLPINWSRLCFIEFSTPPLAARHQRSALSLEMIDANIFAPWVSTSGEFTSGVFSHCIARSHVVDVSTRPAAPGF
jgi:hypothetical protein